MHLLPCTFIHPLVLSCSHIHSHILPFTFMYSHAHPCTSMHVLYTHALYCTPMLLPCTPVLSLVFPCCHLYSHILPFTPTYYAFPCGTPMYIHACLCTSIHTIPVVVKTALSCRYARNCECVIETTMLAHWHNECSYTSFLLYSGFYIQYTAMQVTYSYHEL